MPQGTESCQQPCARAQEQLLSQLNLEMIMALNNTEPATCEGPGIRATSKAAPETQPRETETMTVAHFKLLHSEVISFLARDN